MNPTGKAGGRISESSGNGYGYEIFSLKHAVQRILLTKAKSRLLS